MLLASSEVRDSIEIVHAPYLDCIRCKIDRGPRLTCMYLPPSIPEDERVDLLWQYNDADVIFGDINFRAEGRAKSSCAARAGLDRFAEASDFVWHDSGDNLDHLFAKPLWIAGYGLEETNIRTDHLLQRFELLAQKIHGEGEVSGQIHVQYEYQSAFHILTPLLTSSCRSAFRDKMCNEYSDRERAVELLFEEQRLMQAEGLITPQEAVDIMDEVLLDALHQTCDAVLQKVKRRGKGRALPEQAPKTNSAAVRLFKSLRKATTKPIVAASPDKTVETAVRERYCELWQDRDRPLNAPMPAKTPDESLLLTTPSGVAKIIREYSSTKSAGPDGAHVVALKALNRTSFAKHFADMANFAGVHGVTPVRWNTAITALISKRDDNQSPLPTEVRPISITTIFRRVFEKALLTHLGPHARLNPNQYGFRKGYDCLSNILTVESAREAGIHGRIITDFAEAYDRTVWARLQEKLESKGFPSIMRRLIWSLMFTNMYSILIVNGRQQPRIRLNRGLFQGSLLSPMLFNVYVDDLLDELYEQTATQENRRPAAMYADDLLLLWRDPQEALRMWNVLQCWCDRNGMLLKLRKCGYVHLYKCALLEALGLDRKESFTHLGIVMTTRGIDWQQQVSKTTAKAGKVLGLLQRCCLTWPSLAKIQLIRTFVLPIVSYGIPLLVANGCKAWQDNGITCCRRFAQRLKEGHDKQIWKTLNSLMSRCHTFAIGTKVNQALNIAVSAMENFSTRAVELTLQYVATSLRFLGESNPALHCVSGTSRWFWQPHPIMTGFPHREPGVTAELYKMTIKNHIKNLKRERLKSYVERFPEKHRNPSNLTDIILACADAALEKHLVHWRAGAFGKGGGRHCVCGLPFRQEHMTTCASRAGLPVVDVNALIGEKRWADLKNILTEWWLLLEPQ